MTPVVTVSVEVPIAPIAMDVADWLAEQGDAQQAAFLTRFVHRLDAVCGGLGDHQLCCLFAEMSPTIRSRIKGAIE